jgi:hypothetical protein
MSKRRPECPSTAAMSQRRASVRAGYKAPDLIVAYRVIARRPEGAAAIQGVYTYAPLLD